MKRSQNCPVEYPLKVDTLVAYAPVKFNYALAKQNTVELRNKLLQFDHMDSFIQQLEQDIELCHLEILKSSRCVKCFARSALFWY